ncbi:MAG: glycosyltransferase [Flavobacteriaceae bacterium]|jgi:glycosyltransferase involved in cell wall biosynthesis|nr:glycosyltransferase [Flavobacteriaceae bacterium]
MKVFQISSEVNTGSVGRIAEQIGECILEQGWESYIAYGRDKRSSASKIIKIGNRLDVLKHVLLTRLTDRHGFGAKSATLRLIKEIKRFEPDIIQLQHLHGYFINIELLFNFLSKANIPVVWTFHDCWSFTGHCSHYEYIDCNKWKSQCQKCPQLNEYPKSSLIDNSYRNYNDKKKLFNSVSNLTIIPVSKWLSDEVKKSFLRNNSITVIQNGIDLEVFRPVLGSRIIKKYKIDSKFVILGVASPWNERKGLNFFIELNECIDQGRYQIILVGLNDEQLKNIPKSIIGLQRTEDVNELAEFYSIADVFVNPTLEDTFPTTNLEALACGTPVITFRSGGSPEAIDDNTGIVVKKGDVQGLKNAISIIKEKGKSYYQENCRNRAELLFDKKRNFLKYIELYKKIKQ